MPISEKIIKEIHDLSVSDREKQLMLDLLDIEDLGVYQYVHPYERKIKKYIQEMDTSVDEEGSGSVK